MKLFCAFLMALSGIFSASAEMIRDVECSWASPLTGGGRELFNYGYIEHPIVLRNLGTQTRTVRFSAFDDGFRTTAVLQPGAVRRIGVWQTRTMPFSSSELRVRVDGEQLKLPISSGRGGYGSVQEKVLLSQSIPYSSGKFFQPGKGGSSQEITYSPASVPVREWSPNVLAYSSFAAVMLTRKDFDEAPPAVREALEDYKWLGGVLIFTETGRESAHFHGFGAEFSLAGDPTPKDLSKWIRMRAEWSRAAQARDRLTMQDDVFQGQEGQTFAPKPRPGLILAILSVFAVLIGPVSFYVLRRKKKPLAILWTSPLLSLAFIAILLVTISFSEGWFTRVKIASITFLEEDSSRATTATLLGVYAPHPPGALEFSTSSILELGRLRRYGGEEKNLYTAFGETQRLSGDWFLPRMPGLMSVRRTETRRERVAVVGLDAEGRLEVVNGLGAEITQLHYHYANGKRYENAAPIVPGQKALLHEVSAAEGGAINARDYVWSLLDGHFSNYTPRVPRGFYRARLGTSPFAETGFSSGKREWVSALVLGKGEVKP